MGMIAALLSLLLAAAPMQEVGAFVALHRHVFDAVARRAAPGVSAATVLPNGEVRCASAGSTGRNNPSVMDCDTRFLSGSVGKTVTALIAVQLADEGVVDLDAPVSTWLSARPWWNELNNRDAITLRMLLNHSAGVPDYVEDVDFFLAGLRRGDRGYTPDETIAFVARDTPSGEPGAHYAYSDTHYILAGLVLEAATGDAYTNLVVERVLRPLQMYQTTPLEGRDYRFLADGHVPGLFGTRRTASRGRLERDFSYEWAAGGLVTTPSDLARLFAALGDGGLFAAEGRRMRADINAFDDTGRTGYGLGIFVRINEDGTYRISHGGDFAGYRSAALYDSARGIALAVQANSKEFEAPDFAFGLLEAIVEFSF